MKLHEIKVGSFIKSIDFFFPKETILLLLSKTPFGHEKNYIEYVFFVKNRIITKKIAITSAFDNNCGSNCKRHCKTKKHHFWLPL